MGYLFAKSGDPIHVPRCHQNTHGKKYPDCCEQVVFSPNGPPSPFPPRKPAYFRLRLSLGHFASATFSLGGLWPHQTTPAFSLPNLNIFSLLYLITSIWKESFGSPAVGRSPRPDACWDVYIDPGKGQNRLRNSASSP